LGLNGPRDSSTPATSPSRDVSSPATVIDQCQRASISRERGRRRSPTPARHFDYGRFGDLRLGYFPLGSSYRAREHTTISRVIPDCSQQCCVDGTAMAATRPDRPRRPGRWSSESIYLDRETPRGRSRPLPGFVTTRGRPFLEPLDPRDGSLVLTRKPRADPPSRRPKRPVATSPRPVPPAERDEARPPGEILSGANTTVRKTETVVLDTKV
jgi:hypothetical protein